MHQPSVVLEPVCCPLCQSDRSSVVLVGPDRLHQVPGCFTLCQCLDCGLIYQNPRPAAESFDAIYPDAYEPHQADALRSATLHPDWIRTCAFVQHMQPDGGRLLDVGCGAGIFLRALHQVQPHWQTMGIEPDAQAAALARQHGLSVQQTTLEAAGLAAGSFEAITAWNVLEHLPDPLGSLRFLQHLLRPEGILYLAVPLCDSWDARLFGRYWLGWELPRHFVLFSRATLEAMLNQAGFELITTACLSGVEYCFTESVRLFLHEQVRRYTLRRLSIAVTYSRPFRLLLRPYLYRAQQAGRSTVLTIAARCSSTAESTGT